MKVENFRRAQLMGQVHRSGIHSLTKEELHEFLPMHLRKKMLSAYDEIAVEEDNNALYELSKGDLEFILAADTGLEVPPLESI